MSNATLAAKVKAVNRAHATAIEVFKLLQPRFVGLVGQKVEKADGQLFEKIKRTLPELPYSVPLSVFRHGSNYSLAWTVKTCEGIEGTHTCLYHEHTVYIGDVRNGVLTKVYEKPPELRTDYTVEEVMTRRQTYTEAKRVVDDAFSALHPFGEYDR